MAMELENKKAHKDLKHVVEQTLVVVFATGTVPQVFLSRGFP